MGICKVYFNDCGIIVFPRYYIQNIIFRLWEWHYQVFQNNMSLMTFNYIDKSFKIKAYGKCTQITFKQSGNNPKKIVN